MHLALAGFFGMLFFLVTRELPSTRPAVVVAAGVVWGLLVALLMVPVLGLAGREVGGGTLIADTPSQMGWSTYLLMHLVYGSSLGAVVALVRRG